MKECWRWFGPLDKITLPEVAQTGARGVVTALHEVPYGEVWPVETIRARQGLIAADASLGLDWEVVESLPVHEDIKRGSGDLGRLFANYRQSLANLAQCGVRTVCYNFMPVLDWVRTDHATKMRGGGLALTFSEPKMAAFEVYILRRAGAEADYSEPVLAQAQDWFGRSSGAERDQLLSNIMAGLPGAYERYSVEGLRGAIDRYAGMQAEDLRATLGRFLAEVVPAAAELGMRLCIHPDDPPRPVFGLPRIVSTAPDIAAVLAMQDDEANGLTFCSGSLGARAGNDLEEMARRFAGRTHFLHLRNVSKAPDGSFTEDGHLAGDTDMVGLISVWLAEEARRREAGHLAPELPFRPDHGHVLAPDAGRNTHAGYPLVGRLKGLAELRGVIAALGPRSLEDRSRALVADLGIAARSAVLTVRPLAGGVASDIAVVDLGARQVCVKFALARLKVAQDWRAPVQRNRAEYAWLEFAGTVAPGNTPRLFGWSATGNGFAMEYLAGPGVRLWKVDLLAGRTPAVAGAVGAVLGRIHQASAAPDFETGLFENRDDFRALRIEPYLSFTAARHPPVAAKLAALAQGLYAARQVLVHGDVSPKNIMLRQGGPVFLDAECATMGDGAFDISFCLNHLILKALHLPGQRAALLAEALALWQAYAPHVTWEDRGGLEARVAALTPALMLARVDGKSPVEYLTGAERDEVRRLALAFIADSPVTVAELVAGTGARLDAG